MASYSGEKERGFLETVMKNRPDSLLFARLADTYRKDGNISQAIELCIRGLNTYPYYTTGRILLGRCYLEQQRYGEAIEAFSAVCAVDRRNQMAIKMLADIFVEQGMQQQAGELYALLLKMDPVNPALSRLCSQYRSAAGERDIFMILGLPSPMGADAAFHDTGAPPQAVAEEMQPDAVTDYTTVESGPAEPLQTTEFGGEEMHAAGAVIDYQEQPGDVSGADIADRMSMLFDEQPQVDKPETLLEESLDGPPLETVIEPVADTDGEGEAAGVCGTDISERIEEIFNEQSRSSDGTLSVKVMESALPDQLPKRLADDDSGVSLLGQDFDFSDISVETVQINRDGRDISPEPADTRIDMPSENVSGIQEYPYSHASQSGIELPAAGDSLMETSDVSGADVSLRIEELFSDKPQYGQDVVPEATHLQEESNAESAAGSTIEMLDAVAENRMPENIVGSLDGETPEFRSSPVEEDLAIDEFPESIQPDEISFGQEPVALEEDREISGNDVSDRIGDLLEAAEKGSSEAIAAPDLQLEIPETGGQMDFFTESSVLPQETLSFEEENISGSDVSHRMEEIFEAQDAPFSVEVQELQSRVGEAEFSVPSGDAPLRQDHDEIDISDLSMVQTSDELFTGASGSGDGIVTPEEESVFEPDFTSSEFAETMQFDHELFERMLNPSDDDAAFQEGQTLIDATLPQDGAAVETSPPAGHFATDVTESFELFSEGGNEPGVIADQGAHQPGDLFATEPDYKGEKAAFEPLAEAPGVHAGFEVTTERYAFEDPELVIDAGDSAGAAVLDSTATFERATDGRGGEDSCIVLDNKETGGAPSDSAVSEEHGIRAEELISEAFVDDGTAGGFAYSADAAPSDEDVAGQIEQLFSGEAVPRQPADDRDGTDRRRIDGSPAADESLIAEASYRNAGEDEAAFIETMQLTRDDLLAEEAAVPAAHFETQPVNGAAAEATAFPQESEQVDGPPVISGNDVSDRIDDLFSATDLMGLPSEAGMLPEDDSSDGMAQVAEFYTIAGEDASQGMEGELPERISEVEFDAASLVDKSAFSGPSIDRMLEEGAGDAGQAVPPDADILPEVELYEEVTPAQTPLEGLAATVPNAAPPDDRDRPFSIPDHVLTPTLADIYHQQGQHELAEQIYRRLLEHDPENEKLIARIREIRSAVEHNAAPKPQQGRGISRRRTTAGKPGRNRSEAEKKEDPRPLAGIHLNKHVKNAARIARKRK